MRLILIIFLLLAYQAQGVPRYLSTNGSDSNGGTSWSDSWLTWDKVQTTWSGGDTVYIGAGIYREIIDSIPSGTNADRTAIIDSSWNETPGVRKAYFYGSDILTGWELSSGNIYKMSPATNPDGVKYNLWQGDSLMYQQATIGAVDAAGEWYWNGTDTIYLYAVGGGDPDSYEIEYSTRQLMHFREGVLSPAHATDFATVLGIGFKYYWERGINMYSASSTSQACDSVFFDHCFVKYGAGQGDGNPAAIFSGQTSVAGERNRIRGDSLSDVRALNPATLQPYGGSAWGSATAFYMMAHMQVDSNVVYGYFENSGIYFKGGYGSPMKDGNVIAHNYINLTENPNYDAGIRLYSELINTRVYGNTIIGAGNAILIEWGQPSDPTGYGHYFNNTIYECTRFFFHGNGQGGGYDTRTRPHMDTIKYNVVHKTGALDLVWGELVADGGIFSDSNLIYYTTTFTNTHDYDGGDSTGTLTGWQDVVGNDSLSTFGVYPTFADTAGGDFSRASASSEMNRTYGGQTWTIFGAVQNASDPDPVVEQISGKVILSGKVK